jgi:hypothetical protein
LRKPWRVSSPLTVLYERNDEAGTPSIANSKPHQTGEPSIVV